jgi:hypothetical protein
MAGFYPIFGLWRASIRNRSAASVWVVISLNFSRPWSSVIDLTPRKAERTEIVAVSYTLLSVDNSSRWPSELILSSICLAKTIRKRASCSRVRTTLATLYKIRCLRGFCRY